MKRFVALTLLLASCGSAVASDAVVVAVMDPLAAPLSCPCVEGYAQRDYAVLGDSLSRAIDRPVVVGFGETLSDAIEDANAERAHLVIGKDSVVRSDLAKLRVEAMPVAQLTGKDGETTQNGLLVVASADAAQGVEDLAGYDVYYGPAECDEKHAAARALLASSGVEIGESLVSPACSDGASELLERQKTAGATPAAAVISSYAAPLLEGCGTIAKGDLRVVGETAPVPFITAFVTEHADEAIVVPLVEALYGAVAEPETLAALETLRGFTPPGPDYQGGQMVPAEVTPNAKGEQTPTENEAAASSRASPADNAAWPGFRGPTRDGVVAWLPAELPATPRFVWRQRMSRSGLGGIAVAEGRVVIGDRDFSNRLDVWRCFDAVTGEELWKHRYPAVGQLDYDNAPRATPLIDGGRVYLLGAFGDVACVRLDDGKRVWRRPLRREYGDRGKLVWGACCSPLLVGDTLIVCPAADDALWIGLDASTGRERWVAGGDGHAFASPVVARLGDTPQLIGYDRTTLGGWNPTTGERLWSLTPRLDGDFNVPTPAIVGDRLFVVTENNGARLYEPNGAGLATPPVATHEGLLPDTSSPTVLGDRVYCVWNALYCLRGGDLSEAWIGEDDSLPETGAVLAGRTAGGAGRLLVVGRGGELLLVDADADAFRIVSRLNLFSVDPAEAEDLLCTPAIVGSRLYLRTDDELVCVELI
ncbi:MAG: PQQ-binding-like beta-propeller repeat protein [Planctomycetota bacterium]